MYQKFTQFPFLYPSRKLVFVLQLLKYFIFHIVHLKCQSFPIANMKGKIKLDFRCKKSHNYKVEDNKTRHILNERLKTNLIF